MKNSTKNSTSPPPVNPSPSPRFPVSPSPRPPVSVNTSPRLPIFLPVTPIRRFFSRIAIRVMAFNLLLLFLPFAGILYLGFYEKRLEAAQERSMRAQARVLAATLSNRGKLNQQQAEFILDQLAPSPLDESRSRLRILDPT